MNEIVKPKECGMESRNLHFNFLIFLAVKKESDISLARKPALLRAFIGVVTALLITVKLTTPFLHTHQFETPSSKGVSISSAHCEACEYEATQAIEPSVAIVLPSALFNFEIKSFETESVFFNPIQSSSESRGPPSIS